jgi:hypothetical protein
MQGIYTYIPETNNVPKEYNVAAIIIIIVIIIIELVDLQDVAIKKHVWLLFASCPVDKMWDLCKVFGCLKNDLSAHLERDIYLKCVTFVKCFV